MTQSTAAMLKSFRRLTSPVYPNQEPRARARPARECGGGKETLPRSVQAGLYQHNQHTRTPTRTSTLRKTRTVHPRSRRSQSERLPQPYLGQHTHPPPLDRPRPSWTPSRGARGRAGVGPPRRRTLSGECQPTRDAPPNSTNNPTLGWSYGKEAQQGHVPSRYSEEGKDEEGDAGARTRSGGEDQQEPGTRLNEEPSLRPCSRGPTGPKAKATTKDQRSDGRSEAEAWSLF